MTWTAYVDESEPDPRPGSAGVYLLAAAVIEDIDEDDARAAMASLRLRGQHKLHWHAEKAKRRTVLAETVGRLPAVHLVVVRTDADATSERRRRLCLQRLLPELDRAGVPDVYLESRERTQNQHDMQLLSALRTRQVVGTGMRMHHLPGPADPLLWMPDVVAGAVSSGHRGDPTYVAYLAGLVTYYEA